MRKALITGAILVVLSMAVVAWAAPGGQGDKRGGHQGRGAHGPGDRLGWVLRDSAVAEEIGLTEADIAALEDLRYEQQKEAISLRAASELARLEVRRLLEQDDPNEAAVMKALDNAGQAELAVRKAQVAHMLRVKKQLGPEKADKLREAQRESMQERREPKTCRRGSDRRGKRFGSSRGHRGRWQHGPEAEWDDAPPVEEDEPME